MFKEYTSILIEFVLPGLKSTLIGNYKNYFKTHLYEYLLNIKWDAAAFPLYKKVLNIATKIITGFIVETLSIKVYICVCVYIFICI